MESSSTASHLQVDSTDLPDLTERLQTAKKVIGKGSYGIAWYCKDTRNVEVVVKTNWYPRLFDRALEHELSRKTRREIEIWRRLDHPNIVPLLGRARGEDFASEYPCIISMWMPNGALHDYVKQNEFLLSLSSRIRLITRIATGLEYLHSKNIVHGNLHPGNILIDSDYNPRITDFGYSHALSLQQKLTCLWTSTVRPGARQWVAPEFLYPELFPGLEFGATPNADIYSLGSIILFIFSARLPWRDQAYFESQIKQLKNPPRPPWPVIPDGIWDFLERCWSPRAPKSRPSAQEVVSFSRDRLEHLLQPICTSGINVVLLGSVGCGKSSIVNLLSEKPVAPVSINMKPCTRQPQSYRIPIGESQFQLWDTTGFCLPIGADIDPLSPYEQAHAVFRNLPNGVHLILLCASMDEIRSSNPWLRSLYWFINEFFFHGHAPVAFILTHFDTPQIDLEGWWKSNQDIIIGNTDIPVSSIPRACSTTAQSGCEKSKQVLKALLENYANAPVAPRLDFSSCTTSLRLASQCGLSTARATTLVKQFSKPLPPLDGTSFGGSAVRKNSFSNIMVPDIIPDELPDRTGDLQPEKKRFVAQGSFSVVFRCPDTTRGEVAVKAIVFPSGIRDDQRQKLERSLRRRLRIWRRLDHPNIVLLLGKTRGVGFGLDHDCMVSMWMPRGTLHMYIKDQALVNSDRVRLIKDMAHGLNYLHSRNVVHGNLHPGNVLIDDGGNARLSDFGLSQVLLPADDTLSYLRTMSAHPGAVMWTAPELAYPELFPEWGKEGKPRVSPNSDMYSFGNLTLFVLSEKTPWPTVSMAWGQLKKRAHPPHRAFSTIPDQVWKFLKTCWSPKNPGIRPPSDRVVSFISDTLAPSYSA